ncbi:nucleotidyltransferase domain-containing protein [Micromonospora zamorensis]|uniref:nucleotidyltransferase domain-containing protein n=1 Tax=Micromonospora zamorensis TaxID=709883 RepID=UPI003D979B55
MTATTLRPEDDLLLALAAPRWGAASDDAVQKWREARVPMDWPYFLDQALCQQVICMVGRNLVRQLPSDKAILPHMWVYSAAYEANARRNRSLFTEFGRILQKLNRRGVRYAVRKGPSLCALVYDDPALRRMSDLDVLIDRESLNDTGEILAELGYAQGVLSPGGDRVIPHERRTQMFWSVHLNNALPFLKPTSDPEVRRFEVDLCFDLFQKRSVGSVAVGAVLDRARPVVLCGEASFALSPLDQLLDLCLHLYKEATSFLSIAQGRDLNLARFLDVRETIRVTSRGDLDRLPQYARELGADRELYFALYHASLLYPDAIPDELVKQLEPQDCSYLDEYGELEGRTGRWRKGFLDRLFNPDRWIELPGASSIPTT